VRFWLRFGDHDVELLPGETLLGRSPKCQIVLDDAMVSRMHARIMLGRGMVTIEDTGSVNGVIVNGERLTRPRLLKSRDKVVIGQQAFELYAAELEQHAPVSRRDRTSARTLSGAPGLELPTERTEATRQGDAFNMLAGVADKVLALGRGDEAERILGHFLRGVLQSARIGNPADSEVTERAASYAIRIAEATKKASWIDYVFELYTSCRRALPGPVVERLYTTLRVVPGASITIFRRYLEELQRLDERMGPGERFVVRRLQGLDSLLR
jgi:pSer/pThr/pTyr-binding forkhead associated (FHA) protein